MKRLEKKFHIPVFIIFGNHDFYQKERYWFSFPKMSIYLHPETVETKNNDKKWRTSLSVDLVIDNSLDSKDKVMEFSSRTHGITILICITGNLVPLKRGTMLLSSLQKMQEKIRLKLGFGAYPCANSS